MRKIIYPLLLALSVSFSACIGDNEDELSELSPVELSMNPEEILTEFDLGRVLFYDRQLSVNNSLSCASCHKQAFAFADNVAFSAGFENRMTTRNSMPIQNLGTSFSIEDFEKSINVPSTPLFWDGREQNIFEMVLKPIVNHREMGVRDLDYFTEKLNQIDYYKIAFKNIYGEQKITWNTLSSALGVFVASIHSRNTRFDQYAQSGEGLNALELQGLSLFFEKYDCNGCHQVQSPSGYLTVGGGFSNVGLDQVYDDPGLQEVTGRESDAGKFKIPSLRNVALTAPYMHDGRFKTLGEVIEHYSTGLTSNPNLDFRLKDSKGEPLVFNITEQEKQAIVAFLNTLTDYSMISDPKLSNPFK